MRITLLKTVWLIVVILASSNFRTVNNELCDSAKCELNERIYISKTATTQIIKDSATSYCQTRI